MALIEAVVTDKAREIWLKMFGTLVPGEGLDTPFSPILKFRIGEGGFEWDGPNKVRKLPDPTRNTLEAQDDSELAVFSKDLIVTDFVFWDPAILRVFCLLEYNDFNTRDSDPSYTGPDPGDPPEIFEIGLFSEIYGEEFMAAYGTVDKQIKTDERQILNIVRVTAQR